MKHKSSDSDPRIVGKGGKNALESNKDYRRKTNGNLSKNSPATEKLLFSGGVIPRSGTLNTNKEGAA